MTAKIGLVSISDRASQGVYQDMGLPGLKDWLSAALSSPWVAVERLIPDEREVISQTLIELVDQERCDLDPRVRSGLDRKSTRLNSSHPSLSRMPSSA